MSEAKFTKGPLYAVDNGQFWEVAVCNSPYSQSVGQCHVNSPLGVSVEEAKHNAILYAAAPDMYEALETADRMMWALGACDSVGHNIIKSALAKARGEEIK